MGVINSRYSTRVLVNNKLQNTIKHNSNDHITHTHVHEKSTLQKLKEKLKGNNAFIAIADKDNSVIILNKNDYDSKVYKFFKDNNIEKLKDDPPKK